MLEQLLPVIFLFCVVIAFGVGMIALTQLAGYKAKKNAVKMMPYESGIPGQDASSTKISVKFYLTAVSFILFDIEVVFLYPWLLVYSEYIKPYGAFLLGSMGLFTLILVYGLIYEIKSGALEWD